AGRRVVPGARAEVLFHVLVAQSGEGVGELVRVADPERGGQALLVALGMAQRQRAPAEASPLARGIEDQEGSGEVSDAAEAPAGEVGGRVRVRRDRLPGQGGGLAV